MIQVNGYYYGRKEVYTKEYIEAWKKFRALKRISNPFIKRMYRYSWVSYGLVVYVKFMLLAPWCLGIVQFLVELMYKVILKIF